MSRSSFAARHERVGFQAVHRESWCCGLAGDDVAVSLDESASAAVERALRRQAGDAAADAAKAVITPGTWDDTDVRWQVVAVSCCEVCDRWNGQVMTLPELEELVMPLGGPVHGCEREGACECSAMPARAADV